MKRNLKLLLAVGLFLFSVLTLYSKTDVVYAEEATIIASGSCGDDLLWILDCDGKLTVSGTGEMYSYVKEEPSVFLPYKDVVKEIEIKPGAVSIGSRTFCSFQQLEKVTIPEGVRAIGTEAFKECTSLEEIRLPEGLEYIEDAAFSDCIELSKIYIPPSVTRLYSEAISGCSKLKTVGPEGGDYNIELGAGIPDCIFLANEYIESVVIPDGISKIPDSAFKYASNLKSVIIPDDVKEIGREAFYDCGNLEDIVMPETMPNVKSHAFTGSNKAEKYNFPFRHDIYGTKDITSIWTSEVLELAPEFYKYEILEGEQLAEQYTESGSFNVMSTVYCIRFKAPGKVKIRVTRSDAENSVSTDWEFVVSEKPLKDISGSEWYFNTVKSIYRNGIMTGYANGNFGPADILTRGQFATVLYRMEGKPEIRYKDVFPDVAEEEFYAEPVVWAYENGIITGYSDSGKFGPSDPINREQANTILYRYAKAKGLDTDISSEKTNRAEDFLDYGNVSEYAKEAVSWAVGIHMMMGQDRLLEPKDNTNRAVAAALLMRYYYYYGGIEGIVVEFY